MPNDQKDEAARDKVFDAASRGLAPHSKPGYDSNGKFDQRLFHSDMATRWISGVIEDNGHNGVFRRRLSGEEDISGRAALAELLFGGHPEDEAIQILAMLIAPDGHHLADDEFKIVIERRSRGAPHNDEMARLVGLFIWEQVKDGTKLEAAIAFAQERFALKRRQIQKHWKTFNDKWRWAHKTYADKRSE